MASKLEAYSKGIIIELLEYMAGEIPQGAYATVYSQRVEHERPNKMGTLIINEEVKLTKESLIYMMEKRSRGETTLVSRTVGIEEFVNANDNMTVLRKMRSDIQVAAEEKNIEMPPRHMLAGHRKMMRS